MSRFVLVHADTLEILVPAARIAQVESRATGSKIFFIDEPPDTAFVVKETPAAILALINSEDETNDAVLDAVKHAQKAMITAEFERNQWKGAALELADAYCDMGEDDCVKAVQVVRRLQTSETPRVEDKQAAPDCAHCGKPFTAGMSCGECGTPIDYDKIERDMALLEAAEWMYANLDKDCYRIGHSQSENRNKHVKAIRAARAAVEGK